MAEYNLFISRARADSDSHKVVDLILKWRKLSEADQDQVVQTLYNAIIPSAKSRTPVSMYERIDRVRPYAWALFTASAEFIVRENDRLVIPTNRTTAAKARLAVHERFGRFIEFDTEKDWFSYFGDADADSSDLTALSVYESRYKLGLALEVLQSAKSKGLLPKALDEKTYIQARLKEKVLEDILEYNLGLLEPGLVLYEEGRTSGRQFETENGRIDLLARSPKAGWVVVELKKGRAGDKVIGQTLRYMGWVKDNRARPTENVRGIIVGYSIDSNLVSAAKATPNLVRLCEFDFRLNVTTVYPPN